MVLVRSPGIAATFRSPVPEAYSWLEGKTFPDDLPLINVSQAAPTDPPPTELREAMADAVLNRSDAHFYGAVLGNWDLRTALARKWSVEHETEVSPHQVAITAGCNQAFTTAIATLCAPQDEVILPTPWYFNHKMWLDMTNVRAVPLATGDNLLPDVEKAKALISEGTRAIALVSPNNPGGVEYPPEVIRAFFDLAREAGIALILDETYRDFSARDGAPHDLFNEPQWDDTLIQLYSFSKAYRLTGHRVGAMCASQNRLAEVEKVLDTVTICPSQVGQIGALWGLNNLDPWLQGERREILRRGKAIKSGFSALESQGWSITGLGGFFAYTKTPFEQPSDEVARRMLDEIHVLALPGTMFAPTGDEDAAGHLRIAFANLDTAGIEKLLDRLKTLTI